MASWEFSNDTESGNETTTSAYDYENYYDYYYDEYYLKTYPFEHVSLGVLQPVLLFLTLLVNVFVVKYFMTKKNRGRPTSVLFVSIAFSDSMTGLLLIPISFYVYAERHENLSLVWCNTFMMLKFYFSPVFHTVSVWQTVLLGVQRYMCVCKPFISRRVCTTQKTIVSIIIMYCLAFALHVYQLTNKKVDNSAFPTCSWKAEVPCVGTCVYLWFCVALQHVIPCVTLIYLTVVTLYNLREARKRVVSMSPRSGSNRVSRDRIITITSTLVVIVFLLPEFPYGMYKLVLAWHAHSGTHSGLHEDRMTNHVIISVYEIVLLVSFHANFWIYCTMMHDFRFTFFKCITFGKIKRGLRHFPGSWSSRKSSETSFISRKDSVAGRSRVFSQTSNVTEVVTLHPAKPLRNLPSSKEISVNSMDEDQNDDVFV